MRSLRKKYEQRNARCLFHDFAPRFDFPRPVVIAMYQRENRPRVAWLFAGEYKLPVMSTVVTNRMINTQEDKGTHGERFRCCLLHHLLTDSEVLDRPQSLVCYRAWGYRNPWFVGGHRRWGTDTYGIDINLYRMKIEKDNVLRRLLCSYLPIY